MEYVSLQMFEYIACTELLVLETNGVILRDICTLFHILGGGYTIFPSNEHNLKRPYAPTWRQGTGEVRYITSYELL